MGTTAPAELPDSVEELRALVLLQQEQNADQARAYESTVSAYSEEIAQLREFIRLLKSPRFGPSRVLHSGVCSTRRKPLWTVRRTQTRARPSRCRRIRADAGVGESRFLRPKYACSSCKDGVKVASPLPQAIPKSLATPSLLAQIITGQYGDGLPL